MDAYLCPKCNEPMDQGSISSGEHIGYVSKKQMGMLRTVTKITEARACPNCGFVEMYLDPKTLRERLGGK